MVATKIAGREAPADCLRSRLRTAQARRSQDPQRTQLLCRYRSPEIGRNLVVGLSVEYGLEPGARAEGAMQTGGRRQAVGGTAGNPTANPRAAHLRIRDHR